MMDSVSCFKKKRSTIKDMYSNLTFVNSTGVTHTQKLNI